MDSVSHPRAHHARLVLGAQGVYYLITGVWPLAHLPSFEAITGPKTDDWLVHTVAALAVAIGLALLVGARRDVATAESVTLACCSAMAFAAIDGWYVAKGILRPIYLCDAVVEVLLVALLLTSERRDPRAAP
jgi:hypothetical protein